MDASEKAKSEDAPDSAPAGTPVELAPTLKRATKTLRNALREACSTDVERADTGELIRVEEVLAIANEAAKEVISVRRRQRVRSASETELSPPMQTSRNVRAADGRDWRVFAVFPSSRRGRPVVRDTFAAGWLSFDSDDETRRLAPIPEKWGDLPDEEILKLCERAEPSARRRRSNESSNDPPKS
jgi:hypothetical protein